MMTYQFWVTAGLFTAAVLFLVVDAPAATRSNRNMQKAMQQFRQQQVKQYQAQQAAAAAIAKAHSSQGRDPPQGVAGSHREDRGRMNGRA